MSPLELPPRADADDPAPMCTTKPTRCPACSSTRLWWNGHRTRAASVMRSGHAHYVPELRSRRLRCARCRHGWTLPTAGPRRGQALPTERGRARCGALRPRFDARRRRDGMLVLAPHRQPMDRVVRERDRRHLDGRMAPVCAPRGSLAPPHARRCRVHPRGCPLNLDARRATLRIDGHRRARVDRSRAQRWR